jgi:hypothetical protein
VAICKKAQAWGSIRVNADPWTRLDNRIFLRQRNPGDASISPGKYLVVVRNPAAKDLMPF